MGERQAREWRQHEEYGQEEYDEAERSSALSRACRHGRDHHWKILA
jgi:hypothetical protein